MKIVVVGASGHAKVVLDLVERMGWDTVTGLIDSSRCGDWPPS